MTINDLIKKYNSKIDYLDLEILIAHSLGRTREFVLTYPEYKIPKLKIENLKLKIARRVKGEPIAYILGHKEFYGLEFAVNKHTLIPRPETEQIVDLVINSIQNTRYKIQDTNIVDVGTGSGNIIISIAKFFLCYPELVSGSRNANTMPVEILKQVQNDNIKYIALDTSAEALKVSKKNAKIHKVDKKIKFLESNLLSAFIQNTKYSIRDTSLIITANLPYLSKDIYESAPVDVKKFEPKSALYSGEAGLWHYRKLLEQIKELTDSCSMPRLASTNGRLHESRQVHASCFLEISPEQKKLLPKIIKSILPKAKVTFTKDLAGKWRVCKIDMPISS